MSEQGGFVWYELATPDPVAAKGFYTAMAGWTAHDTDMPGMTYILFNAGEDQIAGATTLAEQAKAMGAPPNWLGYVSVPDVDALAEKAKSLGGALYAGPMDIPNVGRFAVCADPQGAVFALFKGAEGETSPADVQKPGHFGWHELATSDPDAGFDFYQAMFGWEKGGGVDMGEMGIYQLFGVGGTTIGGMMKRPSAAPASFWLYYINVGDIDAAAARVKAGGGQVLNGPMEVPGGQWVAQCQDPQKANFALVGHRG